MKLYACRNEGITALITEDTWNEIQAWERANDAWMHSVEQGTYDKPFPTPYPTPIFTFASAQDLGPKRQLRSYVTGDFALLNLLVRVLAHGHTDEVQFIVPFSRNLHLRVNLKDPHHTNTTLMREFLDELRFRTSFTDVVRHFGLGIEHVGRDGAFI